VRSSRVTGRRDGARGVSGPPVVPRRRAGGRDVSSQRASAGGVSRPPVVPRRCAGGRDVSRPSGRRKAAKSVRVVAVLAGVALALPSAALAQGGAASPFTPGVPQQSATTPTTTTPTVSTTTSTTAGSSGLSGGSALGIAIGAIVLIAGISFFIWRDARRRAPVRHRAAATADAGARSGSKQRAKPRKLSPAERRRRKRGRAR